MRLARFLISFTCTGGGRPTSSRLIDEPIRWRSDRPISETALLAKRAEFWDTAPAFDGRREMWLAIQAAVDHAEHGDYQMAQAIVDGANLICTDGE